MMVHKTRRQRVRRPVQKKATLCVTFLAQSRVQQWGEQNPQSREGREDRKRGQSVSGEHPRWRLPAGI